MVSIKVILILVLTLFYINYFCVKFIAAIKVSLKLEIDSMIKFVGYGATFVWFVRRWSDTKFTIYGLLFAAVIQDWALFEFIEFGGKFVEIVGTSLHLFDIGFDTLWWIVNGSRVGVSAFFLTAIVFIRTIIRCTIYIIDQDDLIPPWLAELFTTPPELVCIHNPIYWANFSFLTYLLVIVFVHFVETECLLITTAYGWVFRSKILLVQTAPNIVVHSNYFHRQVRLQFRPIQLPHPLIVWIIPVVRVQDWRDLPAWANRILSEQAAAAV